MNKCKRRLSQQIVKTTHIVWLAGGGSAETAHQQTGREEVNEGGNEGLLFLSKQLFQVPAAFYSSELRLSCLGIPFCNCSDYQTTHTDTGCLSASLILFNTSVHFKSIRLFPVESHDARIISGNISRVSVKCVVCVFLTADEGPQVKSHGALQRLVGSAEGVEEEEAGGHRGEEDHHTTEEDDSDVEAGWDGAQQVRKDWETIREEDERTGLLITES